MRSVESVRAASDGLEEARYSTGEGYYSPFDVCEVTFVAGEAIDATARSSASATGWTTDLSFDAAGLIESIAERRN